MDVNAASGITHAVPDRAAAANRTPTDARPAREAEPARRAAEEAAATTAHRHGHHRTAATAPPDHTKPLQLDPAEILPPRRDPAAAAAERDPSATGSGVLKFDVATADVLARFAIHEGTNRVMVTMFQRDTGEVIRELPPREVLDVMAALAGRGLAVDTST